MIINNTNVRGIWAYSDGLVFEPSDFVVKGDQIFICTKPGSTGDPETHPDLYSRYPGNMVSSLEQYKEIIADPEGSDDLYISSKILHAVIQDTYFGLGDSGIIDSRIEASGDFYLHKKLTTLAKEGTTLDNLLTIEGFNNGVVLVSRDLPDIQGVIGSSSKPSRLYEINTDLCAPVSCGSCVPLCPKSAISLSSGDLGGYEIDPDLCDGCAKCVGVCPAQAIIRTARYTNDQIGEDLNSAIEVSRADLDYVFLRQYTYQSGATGYIHRIQELVDPALGKIYFRHSRQVSAEKVYPLEMESSDWKSCIHNDDIKSIEDELQEIRNYMSRSRHSQDSVGFRFRSLYLSEENNGEYSVNLSEYDLSGKIVTVTVQSVPSDPGFPRRTYTSTVDLSEVSETSHYYISREATLQIEKESASQDIYIFRINSNEDSRFIIKDIYFREAIYGYTGYSI